MDDEPKGLLQKQDTFSKEQEREDHTELVEKVQSQSKQLAELERELESLQGDKEMLLSRNKCLEEELQEQREMVLMSRRVHKMMGVAMLDSDSTHNHTHHHNPWWAVEASEYEVGEPVVCDRDLDKVQRYWCCDRFTSLLSFHGI